MDVNFSSIERQKIRMSPNLPAVLYCASCRTRSFCTALVGPPARVQNYLPPNPFRAINFKPHLANAHKHPRCKTKKSASATHFRSNTLKTNAQKSKVESRPSRVKSRNPRRSTLPTPHSPFRPATDAQNPGQ